MNENILLEHMHAYQPRRIVDAFLGIERENLGEKELNFTKYVRDRAVKGLNWFEIVLKPGSVYDEIINLLPERSLNVEPITLKAFQELNPPAFNRLLKLIFNDEATIACTTYSHPIMPVAISQSPFDLRINLSWSLDFYFELFWKKLWEKEQNFPPIFFWLPECAVNSETINLIVETVREKTIEWGWEKEVFIIFILDEYQVENNYRSGIYKLYSAQTPSEIYPFVLLRDHAFSDAISFSSNLGVIIHALKMAISTGMDLVVTASDAENFGGNYDPWKPVLFEELSERMINTTLSDMITVVRRLKASEAFIEYNYWGRLENLPEAKIFENSAWSDFEHWSILREDGGFIVSRQVGGLMRWTGKVRAKSGKTLEETYFLIHERFNPYESRRELRLTNSIWKIAFNHVSAEVKKFISFHLCEFIKKLLKNEYETENVLKKYWKVALKMENEEDFLKNLEDEEIIRPLSEEEKEALKRGLRAYKIGCQDAYISCPTFWSDVETELTWTALALSAAGMVELSWMFKILKEENLLKKTISKYSELFLELGENKYWKEFILRHKMPLDPLLSTLKKRAAKRGYSLDDKIQEIIQTEDIPQEKDLKKRAVQMAEKLFKAALDWKENLRKEDANPHLILVEIFRAFGNYKKAAEYIDQAIWYEWEKSIAPIFKNTKNIFQRVGILHAKHLPSYFEKTKKVGEKEKEEEKVDIRTGW
ncbi:MAG: hypothetical protein ACFE68_06550 [Candidatus Hodarchaeota archaeon]